MLIAVSYLRMNFYIALNKYPANERKRKRRDEKQRWKSLFIKPYCHIATDTGEDNFQGMQFGMD